MGVKILDITLGGKLYAVIRRSISCKIKTSYLHWGTLGIYDEITSIITNANPAVTGRDRRAISVLSSVSIIEYAEI